MCNRLSNIFNIMVVAMMFVTTISAYASQIDTIDIRVVIDQMGTAHVQERWKAEVDDNMTEWYLSMKNLDGMTVKDFRVFDNDRKCYLMCDNPWNVDRSREEKAGKCGVKSISDGCELCWGVETSGFHSWTAEYNLVGLVRKFDDGYGFNHCFVNYGLSSGPKYVRTTICMADSTPLDVQNARIWAFRYHGTCQFADGQVVAENTRPLTTDNSMVVMCLFQNMDFMTDNVVKDSIGSMKWTALEGSDYVENYDGNDYSEGKNVLFKDNEDKDLTWWEIALVILLLGFFTVLIVWMGNVMAFVFDFLFVGVLWNIVSLRPLRIYNRQKKLLGGEDRPYFRGLPINGNLNRAFYILDENNYRFYPQNKNNLVAAYILRLIKCKALSVVNFMENDELVSRLKINSDWESPKIDDSADCKAMDELLNVIRNAAGENLILERNELKKYLKSHDHVRGLVDKMKKEDNGEATQKEYTEVVGLRNFLNDFSQVEVRGTMEVDLWDEYLVYATFFGIADQVVKDFKKYCPDYFALSNIGSQMVDESGNVMNDYNLFSDITRFSEGIASTIGSVSGNGGFSSIGGGGGSTGGGGGGGGR